MVEEDVDERVLEESPDFFEGAMVWCGKPER
jgi:hypothetical protein